MKKKFQNKRPISIVLLLCIIAFVGIMTISHFKLENEIEHLNDKLVDYSEQIVEYDEENAALEQKLKDENSSELLEENARKDGWVLPNERVYADSES